MKKNVDDNQMKLKVSMKLIECGNDPAEVITMVESNFENALRYGYKSTAKIAEYIRTVA